MDVESTLEASSGAAAAATAAPTELEATTTITTASLNSVKNSGSVTPIVIANLASPLSSPSTPPPYLPSSSGGIVSIISDSSSKIFASASPCPTTPRLVSTPPTPPPSPYTAGQLEEKHQNKHEVRTELDLIQCAQKAIEKFAGDKERLIKMDSNPGTPRNLPTTSTVTPASSSVEIAQESIEMTVDDEQETMNKVSKLDQYVPDNWELDKTRCSENQSTEMSTSLPTTSDSFSQQQIQHNQQQPIPLPCPSPPQHSYHLKWIKWKGNKCPIVTQNENGPCPLIAIINVLLLKGRVRLPSMMEVITPNQLIEYLCDCILENIPKSLKEEDQLNYEQNMQDAIAILPKLQTGLDVNVRFTGVSDFEYTPELIFFDLLHIPLYHGWLVDPDDLETAKAINCCSYNQLVDKIITNKTSTRPELAFEALVVEQFLEKTASQLTYYGLSQLNSTVKDGELSVLFRNNHFITLHKYKDELYQLVTDQGFLTESRVVWETLNNIENDGLFVDGDFIPVPPKPCLIVEDQQAQVDQDYLIALSLQEEQKKEFEKEKEWETYKSENGLTELSDEEFARKLQEEEKQKHEQLMAYQDKHEVTSSQSEQQYLANQQHNQTNDSRNASRYPMNKRSQSLPSRKNSSKPDDKSNSKCSMM